MTEIEALFDKKCSCQMCGHTFTTKKIRSRFIKLLNYDTDFCPNYSSAENNPILYHIKVCPDCGYSFSDDVSPYFPPHTKDIIQEKVCAQWSPQSFSGVRTIENAIKTYKLASYCAFLKKEKHVVIAGMYLRIAWLYRMLNDSQQDQRFMKLACHEYTETYSTQDYRGTQISEVRILYLIGELSRRIGNKEQAGKYFSKVIEQQSRTTEPKIVEMTKERWYEMREARV